MTELVICADVHIYSHDSDTSQGDGSVSLQAHQFGPSPNKY